ncbi:MAG TPA: hypothetical protein VMF06_04320 [Candidatus Limnocylindria bacterium]|nr:hypothetical protein [Candidatus Limnocylindria bacterium]
MKHCVALLMAAAALSGTTALGQNFYIALSDWEPKTEPGLTVTFGGALSHSTSEVMYINDFRYILEGEGTYLVFDGSPFATVPHSLAANGQDSVYSGDLFAIHADYFVTPGVYAGSFTVLGGTEEDSMDPLATAGFFLTVIPEPGATLAMSGLALGGWALWHRQIRRHRLS